MSDLKTYDLNGQEIQFTEDDFKLHKVEKKIADTKFETKPTTFAKDAFKRFLKNKSSVVGAIIIGTLLLLSFLLPAVIPYSINGVRPAEKELRPKLRNAGSGFWDGTKKYTAHGIDTSTGLPYGDWNGRPFREDAIVSITKSKEGDIYSDIYTPYGYGGYFIFGNNRLDSTGRMSNLTLFSIKDTDDLQLHFKLASHNVSGRTLGNYRVKLKYPEYTKDKDGNPVTKWHDIIVKDITEPSSRDYYQTTVNLSEGLSRAGFTELNEAKFEVEIMPNENILTYLAFEEFYFTSANDIQGTLFEAFRITDANKKAGEQRGTDGKFPLGYFEIIGHRGVAKANVILADFIYDEYQHVYGTTRVKTFGGSLIRDYIKAGWIEYDFNAADPVKTFKLLNDRSPVRAVYHHETKTSAGETYYELEVELSYYRYYGYSSMPNFLLGTNENGFDIIKLSFSGLKTSLLLAFVVSAVCLSFGLVWGAISGYFGGNIDIAMERFTEILGGVPWIVVMTLAILLIGNNIVTFAMALCLTGWMGIAGRTRTQFYRYKGREYVLASRTLGASDGRLIFKHILPNAMGTIVTSSVLMIPSVIFSEATLSYLNLGLQGSNSFGNILSQNQRYLSSYPALIVFPAVIISLIMISFNLFGNGLRDALNPSLKGSE